MTDGIAWTILTRFEDPHYTDDQRAVAIKHFLEHPGMSISAKKLRPVLSWLLWQVYDDIRELPPSPQTYRGHRNRPLIKPRDENGNIIRTPKEVADNNN